MSLLKRHTRKSGTFKKLRSKSEDVEYTASDLSSLRRRRTIAYKRMCKTHEIGVSAVNDCSQQDMFFSYYQEIKKIGSNFEEAHLAILEILDDEDDEIQERFDDLYYKVICIYRTLTKNETLSPPTVIHREECNSFSNIRLPKIQLPNFYGEIKRFPEYFDTFNALIHKSTSLTDTEKFHYLISSLSGDALTVVKTFPLSSEYYKDAYNALVARYKSKRELAFTCWKEILSVNFNLKNAHDFRKSLDLFEENLCILKSVDLPVNHWDFVLLYHILSKLDTNLRRDFEEKHSNIELPSYSHLKVFLHSKCEALLRDTHFTEQSHQNKSMQKSTYLPAQPKRTSTSQALIAAHEDYSVGGDSKIITRPVVCSYCNDSHTISSCPEFLKLSIDERMQIATDRSWCYNCLRSSHQLKNCTSIFSCRSCKRKHHTMLHRPTTTESNLTTSSLVSRSVANTTVLLATAIVQVRDALGNMQSFRALFDTGSQSNFITESAVSRLTFKPSYTTASVCGLGEAAAPILGDVTCSIGINNETLFQLDFHVLSKICGDQPIANLNTSGWSHIKALPLADPGFDIPGPIDLLFAADVFAESLLEERIKGTSNQPTALKSIFGWLLLGKTRLASTTLRTSELEMELNSLVQRFWELETLPKVQLLTPDESLCERKFISEHTRNNQGRYMLRLPFKENLDPSFVGSRDLALRRFHAIERRLSRDQELASQYANFMFDYIQSGHMSLVPHDELEKGKYYIPHHCVLRPDSATTRLRVVFDASAKDINALSLNDTQLIGPKLQPNIVEILLHFREHKIVFIADVRQMYRQILISPEHRDYQRIFWRASPEESLKEYRLNTVTYGVASSPFLACRTLQQLAEDEGESYPIAKRIMSSDIYVDDVVTGCDSLDTAQVAKSQIITLFDLGGFQLRKWVSNSPELLSDLPAEDCLSGSITLDDSLPPISKVLGLKWDPTTDAFLFEINSFDYTCTKRSILSEIAKIFDPLGFLSPVTIQAKYLIQKLWILGFGWDQTPPEEIIQAWKMYRTQLPQLIQLRIPRKLTCSNAQTYELHGFADSSEIAYGAVIYLRITDKNGQIHVYLVCSKARVAPLKRISLPRLELCAAVLLADLYLFVRDTYLNRISFDTIYFWSDSTVALSWLRSPSTRWATFVANRVSHIQDITPIECWHHISSGDNPADICSRGQFPSDILHNSLWWAGPRWLSEGHENWPSNQITISQDEEVIVNAENRNSVALITESETTHEVSVIDDLLNRHSSLQRVVNVLTYINRFINNSQSPFNANHDNFLNNVERHRALMQIVKHVQGQVFAEQISNINANKPVVKQFRKLNPFLDHQGVLRVGGRISRSGLEYEQKHPAFLPSNHPLTALIIDFIHRNYCHPGINTTHFLLLQQFWIVSAKRSVRRILSKCVQCYRTNPQPLQPFMSDLPSFRVKEVKAFSIVGVDFGGPFRIKLGKHRGAKIDKAYLCLFVCLATKAVHLEVVSTLSADGFIAALRRFIGRRGRCNIIHADRGTNFTGSRNQLLPLMREASNAERIEFKFNPPSAPHFGGVWEIQIKAAKSQLHRVVGDQVLTFEELTTLFIQIEAVLNSRPLCPISSDPNDLSVLTPGHFLTLEPLTAVPDEDLTKINTNRLSRWQLLQAFHQNFWSRWKHEYLNSLTQRAKWTKESKPLKIGSMVIIKDENHSPLHWSFGRVINLLPGADGVTRVAVLKTATNSNVQRPLVKLCPLPIEDN